MLVAHLVPGYVAATWSRSRWEPGWSQSRRALLWAVALGSTVAPDLDVVYNALFRGFVNHSTLWTHSLFVFLGAGAVWWLLRYAKGRRYLRTVVGLIAVGGLSHLMLDAIAHNTPLLYPVSTAAFGIAPSRIVTGGLRAYVGHPIFLLEPLTLGLTVLHWTLNRPSIPVRSIKKHWSRVLCALLLLLLPLALGLAIQIYAYAGEASPAPADAAIVLGAAVWDGRPSPVFEERIKHAIDLYQEGRVRRLIFTGGIGRGDRAAESQVARQYAIAHGVPGEHVYWETRSRTTRENLLEAKGILQRRNLARVLIVSDPLHMKRAVTIARDLGIDAHPSPTPTSRYRTWHSKLRFLLRETYFYASYLLRRPFLYGAVNSTMAMPRPSISTSTCTSAPSGCRI